MSMFRLAAALGLCGTVIAASHLGLAAEQSNSCVVRLAQGGILAEPLPAPVKATDPACSINEPVILVSIADPALPERRIMFPDRPVLSCAMAERFARFAGDIAAPLALGIHGKELVSIATGPGYECRARNRQPGAKLSSHGQGNAVDIAVITLWGGLKISVQKPDDALTVRFIAGLRAAACGAFNTVLGPGSDAAHADHLHLDIEARGRDGQSKLCQ